MLAGSDTTGSFSRSFLLQLLTHQTVYQTLMETEFGEPRLLEEDQERSLFHACVLETLRFSPPASMDLPRLVPRDGIQLPGGAGEFIPGGVEVVASMLCVNRDPTVFGADAGEWNPYRWSRDGPQKATEMEKNMYTFGYGSRICLGKALVEVEIDIAFKKVRFLFDDLSFFF